MAYLALQEYLPLGTALVWFGIAVYQVFRDRYRTWTEVFFLAFCVFVGGYAFSDFLFFTAQTQDQARTAALASFTSLTLAMMFLMLFGVVFYTRMRNPLFLAIIPLFVFLPFLWTGLIEELKPLDPVTGPPPWIVGRYDRLLFPMWAAFILAYAVIGSWAFYRTYKVVARQTKKLTRRMRGLLVSFILAMILGASTNLIRPVLNIQILPLFSTALVIPGIVAFIALSPLSKERLSIAVRRWKARHYDIKMAFLTFLDGTLIASKISPEEQVIDQDLFSGTLDVIQNFMRTSFPTQRGKWLKAITHGDFTLVMERAKYAQITLVLQGEETDQLRRQMRDELLKFEGGNREILAVWKGVPTDATGTDAMLSTFFIEEPEGKG